MLVSSRNTAILPVFFIPGGDKEDLTTHVSLSLSKIYKRREQLWSHQMKTVLSLPIVQQRLAYYCAKRAPSARGFGISDQTGVTLTVK